MNFVTETVVKVIKPEMHSASACSVTPILPSSTIIVLPIQDLGNVWAHCRFFPETPDRWRESNRGSVHFVADDLESFAWTLLFVVLQITKDQKTTDEEEWYNRLLYATYSPTLGRMVRLQYTITENLRCWAYDEHSPILQHFAPLLNDWFVLARSWKPRSSVLLAETAKDDIRFLERSKSFDEKCYKECLALIRRYLPQISDTWPVAP
ncbi:hypothetical protein BDZ97DRAFT_134076 [Flammula alnicola]|nr:hypothetical protein BDZ97DRAFT_134076 [Flammula alnicola]